MRFGFHPLYSPDGGGSGGAAPVADAAAGDGGGASTGTAERPAWVPETAWDPSAGSLKLDALGEHVGALSTFKSEHDAKLAARPEKPDAYKLELPADWKAPDGVEFRLNEADPLLTRARALAHAAGMSQGDFSKLVGDYATDQVKAFEAQTAAFTAEMGKLGDKAQSRIDGATQFLKAKLPASQFEAIQAAVTTAAGVEAIEALMKIASGPSLPTGPAVSAGPNPWSKDTFNLTRQGQILKENPQLAAQFRSAAGVK